MARSKHSAHRRRPLASSAARKMPVYRTRSSAVNASRDATNIAPGGPTTFTKFLKLPAEMRVAIWVEAGGDLLSKSQILPFRLVQKNESRWDRRRNAQLEDLFTRRLPRPNKGVAEVYRSVLNIRLACKDPEGEVMKILKDKFVIHGGVFRFRAAEDIILFRSPMDSYNIELTCQNRAEMLVRLNEPHAAHIQAILAATPLIYDVAQKLALDSSGDPGNLEMLLNFFWLIIPFSVKEIVYLNLYEEVVCPALMPAKPACELVGSSCLRVGYNSVSQVLLCLIRLFILLVFLCFDQSCSNPSSVRVLLDT